jgi:hypothetical protein
MLRDRHRQLLTAYVDGELTERQRQAVLRLLERSAEARALVKTLKDSSAKLRALPRQRLAPDFAQKVLQEIDHRQLRYTRPRPAASIPVWAGLSAAAALLMAVGAGSFWYFTAKREPDRAPLAHVKPDDLPNPRPERDAQSREATDAAAPDTRRPEQPGRQQRAPFAQDSPGRPGPESEGVPDPGSRNTSVLGDAHRNDREMFIRPTSEQMLGLATFLNIRELDPGKLSVALAKDPAFRLELPCKDGNKGWERFQGVFQSALRPSRVKVIVESMAQHQVKSRDPRASFLLYVDDLSPEEWVKVLRRIGDAERNAEATRRGSGQFHSLFISRMTDFDRKEFGEFFGSLARPAPTPPADTPQIEPARATSNGERRSLLVPYSPLRPQAKSPEIKQFFENHPPLRPGAIQVILVIRSVDG